MPREHVLRISPEFPVEVAASMSGQTEFRFPENGGTFTLRFDAIDNDDSLYLQVHDGQSWKLMDLRLFPLITAQGMLGVYMKLSPTPRSIEVLFSQFGFTDGNSSYSWDRLKPYKWRVARFKHYHYVKGPEAWLYIVPKSFLERIGHFLLRYLYGHRPLPPPAREEIEHL